MKLGRQRFHTSFECFIVVLSSVSQDDNRDCSIKLSELGGIDVLNVLGRDSVSFSGSNGGSLSDELLSLLLGFDLGKIVSLHSLDEGNAGLGFSDMLDSHVDSLGDDSTINKLVDNDTDGMGSNIEDLTSLSVVEFVGHTLVDGTISDDINVVSNFVIDEIP